MRLHGWFLWQNSFGGVPPEQGLGKDPGRDPQPLCRGDRDVPGCSVLCWHRGTAGTRRRNDGRDKHSCFHFVGGVQEIRYRASSPER